MAILRWAPFSAFTALERQMREVLDRFETRPSIEGFVWKPATDVYREDGTIIIRSGLPGIDPGEVDIEVEGNLLRISGEKRVARETSEKDRFLRECRYGSYRREVVLPEGVDPDAIVANFDNGVLTVRVPLPVEVAEEAPKKKIAISVPQES